MKRLNAWLERRGSVRARLVGFVCLAILLVGLISASAWFGLNHTYQSLADLKQKTQQQMLFAMTLGVKTTQISAYALRLSQSARALEYQESARQLEHHLSQIHELLKSAHQHALANPAEQFLELAQSLQALEQSVKELLWQAHQRHITHTTILSQFNQTILHLRHMQRLAHHAQLTEEEDLQFLQLERLIEQTMQGALSAQDFATIVRLFEALEPSKAQGALMEEWQKGKTVVEQIITQANVLAEQSQRIHYLIYKINALSKMIEERYTVLAQQEMAIVQAHSEQVQQDLRDYQKVIALLVIFTIALIMVLGGYIDSIIGKRLYSITYALTELARGNHQVRVPQRQYQDEIGELARAFQLFYQQLLTLEQTDALLKAKNNLLSQTYLAMRDGLAIFDAQMNLYSCNKQFLRLLKVTTAMQSQWDLSQLAEYLHTQGAKVYGSDLMINTQCLQEIRLEQEPLELAFAGQILEWRISRLQDGGLVAFLIDRTQRKKLEMDLAHSQKMRSIGHLTGGIAHDFNNFLLVIMGNLDLIDATLLPQAQANRLKRALKAAENSAVLIQRLLAYARKQPLQPVSLSVNALVSEVADLLKHNLAQNIELKLQLEQNLPPAYIDRNQLQTALVNLIVNAKDALEGGGVIVLQTQQKLVQRQYRQEQMIEIAVIDNGCGIDEQTKKQVFEPFFTTKKTDKGSGLGLSMVYGFIRQSKGRIKIESSVGVGTSVYLQLPLARALTPASASLPNPSITFMAKQTLLLVEDNAVLRATLIEQLQLEHYCVVAVSSAEEAMAYLAKSASKVMCLLSDIGLLEIDGIALAHYVREHYPHIAIVLMTGNQTNIIKQAQEFMILHKPFKTAQLLEHIQRATCRHTNKDLPLK